VPTQRPTPAPTPTPAPLPTPPPIEELPGGGQSTIVAAAAPPAPPPADPEPVVAVAEAKSAGHDDFSVTAWLGGEVRPEPDEAGNQRLSAYSVVWRAALRDLVEALAIHLAMPRVLANGGPFGGL